MLLDFLKTSANLKNIPRQGWIDKLEISNPESVADHTFSMAIIGMILSDSKNYNTEKILKMILLHDLAESITGDITPEQKSGVDKKRLEEKTMKEILSNLPKEIQSQYLKIWDEYQDNQTNDANFVHQIDKFEMALQSKIYEKQTNPKKTKVFFESARKEIRDESLVKMLEKLCE
ncbi:MAG: HD domain-containing protein [Nitrosopumilaceae archaeon]|uniref:HD domain-containing protein n=1 Tax=Candidatus Nitrosomaritimum aestuariumsis TaxID=3342354 RepID=A0AC60W998_9ARCH|nr:HD domain-containing protein [Nitrosopumilaceae archaeon]MBA4463535.1 HD domain-containing protein [Nitrosopumilaceae archaeon]NCF22887.1 HD domain-containing protein [Nitrosopumilaceae archaeon]